MIINDETANNVANRQSLLERSSLPMFQDTKYAKVWVLHSARKDDFLIYGKDGKLKAFLPHADEKINTNLSTPEGYAFVKKTLLDVVAQ